jgi:KDO2-lipid IV(A) lauroyltransferase
MYLILKLVFFFIPTPLIYLFSDFLSFILYHVIKYRRKVVFENLQNSFPDKSVQELNKISRQFYSNLTDTILETLLIPSLTKKQFTQKVIQKNPELPLYYLTKGQSIIVLTGHQCNWEWLLLSSCMISDYTIDAIYRPLKSKQSDSFFLKLRSRFGANLIPMKDTLRSIIRRKDITRTIAMVADQTPPGGEIQYWTKFLNQDTPFFVGADKIARTTSFPVLYLSMKRIRRGYYETRFELLAEAPFPEEKFSVVERYVKALEKTIIDAPSDWLWSHKRWKNVWLKNKDLA